MLETKLSRKAYGLIFAVAALASIVMSVESCNTSQTPALRDEPTTCHRCYAD
jgi:hypothetical protein